VPHRAHTGDQNAVAAVAGNDVVYPHQHSPRSTDGVVGRTVYDDNAVAGVRHGNEGGGVVGANEIAQHHVHVRSDVRNMHPIAGVAPVDVELSGLRAAHRVAGGTVDDRHAVAVVGKSAEGVRCVRPDEVAQDDVPGREVIGDADAVAAVAR